MTLSQLIATQRTRLTSAGIAEGEAQALVREILLRLKGYSNTDIAYHASDEATEYLSTHTADTVSRIIDGEPVQYIFGMAHFHGMELHVSPDVLIPRPETSELVDLIADHYRDTADLRVMDLCTGSGCIAIALSRELKFARVSAIDISEAALRIARQNASDLKALVDFSLMDILKAQVPAAGEYDVIVSNPPYICESEKSGMEKNVLDHEPHTALFVPDSDPLLFYRHISLYARRSLTSGGTLWLEINPMHADALRRLPEADGWIDVNILRDTAGRERFTVAQQP